MAVFQCWEMFNSSTIAPLLLWNIVEKEQHSYTIILRDWVFMDRQDGRQQSSLQVVHTYGQLQVAHDGVEVPPAPPSL